MCSEPKHMDSFLLPLCVCLKPFRSPRRNAYTVSGITVLGEMNIRIITITITITTTTTTTKTLYLMNSDLLNIKHCVVLMQSLNVTQILVSAEYLLRFLVHLSWGGQRGWCPIFWAKTHGLSYIYIDSDHHSIWKYPKINSAKSTLNTRHLEYSLNYTRFHGSLSIFHSVANESNTYWRNNITWLKYS